MSHSAARGGRPDASASRGRVVARPADLPRWFEPLLTRAGECRTEDFTSLRPPVDGGRRSAVLVLLGESESEGESEGASEGASESENRSETKPGVPDWQGSGGPDLLLLQRAATMRNHAGQPAFPGGGTDPEDIDAAATALREAQEEVGLDPASAVPVALLPDLYIPVSSFVVTPVLAWWRQPHPVSPRQLGEVAHVARLPVSELVEPANRLRVRHPSGWIGPAFQVRGMLVWGFTAGIVSTVLDMAGWARPWATDGVVELPPAIASVPAARGGAPDEVLP